MSKKNALMTSKKLLGLLNDAIAREIQVAIQYMWQRVHWSGVKGFAVQEELQKTAIAEMKHAEKIAERLFYLGDIPTTKPSTIFGGKTLKEMVKRDIEDEMNAIKMYKGIIEVATEEKDVTTAFIFKEILEEEEHHDTFTTLMEDLK